MRTSLLLALAASTIAAPVNQYTRDVNDTTTSPQDTLARMQEIYLENTKQLYSGSCTPENVRVRKSWSALCNDEKRAYLDAVKCLASKPTTLNTTEVPGARNRRDDFVYIHLKQGNYVHNSGLLLPWHRQFVQGYEDALRDECGYTGAQPYWDWAEHSDDQSKSPVFDGSELSFGGDGIFIPNRTVLTSPLRDILVNGSEFNLTYLPGTGGGCITSGYFADMNVTLGPVAPANNPSDNLQGLKDNNRCLNRDFNATISQQYLNYSAIVDLMQQPDIHTFHPSLEQSMHPNSHLSVAGELGDFYTSPNDPAFYLLHAQHDRLWAIWQGQDYEGRLNGTDGTLTLLNSPPSPNATLDTVMTMGAAGGSVQIGEVASTVSGQRNYCYIYE